MSQLCNSLLRQQVKQQKAQAECYCSQPHGQWKAQLVLSGTHPILREILHTIQEWLSLEMLDVKSSPKLCSLSTWEFVTLKAQDEAVQYRVHLERNVLGRRRI